MFNVQAVVDAVLEVTKGPALHHRPLVSNQDVSAIVDQADDLGSYRHIESLQEQLKQKLRVKHAVATANGSAALEVALHLVGVQPGDRVLVPSVNFVAAANAVTRLDAMPIFVDACQHDLGIDPSRVFDLCKNVMFSKPPTAIIATHVLGHPCSISSLNNISITYGIPLIEDAAEAIGSSATDVDCSWRPCGSWGTVSVMSFNLNKAVTAGGGGAIMTNDIDLAVRAGHLITTGRVPHPWLIDHNRTAWNHRMAMLPAALAASQMRRLDDILSAKRSIARAYRLALQNVGGVTFHDEPDGTYSNFWLPTIMVPAESRDAVLTALHERGVMARALFTPMHRLPMYRWHGGSFPVADEALARAICLPGGLELAEGLDDRRDEASKGHADTPGTG